MNTHVSLNKQEINDVWRRINRIADPIINSDLSTKFVRLIKAEDLLKSTKKTVEIRHEEFWKAINHIEKTNE